MTESELQRVYIHSIYLGDSKINGKKGFKNIDKGSLRGTHSTCFYIQDHQSFDFDSFRGAADKFVSTQLPKPLVFNIKKQDINSRLYGSYCLHFFYLIERMKCYDVVLKNVLVK